MSAWTDDRGNLSRRLASIRPAELHQALTGAAIEGIRHGLPAELLDGYEAARNGRSLGYQLDRRQTRLEHLDEQIGQCEREAANARRNANLTDDDDLARQFMDDSSEARRRAAKMRGERDDLKNSIGTLGISFASEADYLAHGLARLASIDGKADGAFGDALSQILTITRMDTTTEPGQVVVTFTLAVPADGLVARLGPLTCRVANRAYPGTLGHTLPAPISELPLVVGARAHGVLDRLRHTNPHAVLRTVGEALTAKDYSSIAAGTLIRADRASLHAVIAADLWGDMLPAELDPAYADHVTRIYKAPAFSWNPRYYELDPARRQLLVDTVREAGGRIGMTDLLLKLEGTGIDHLRVGALSRQQQCGDAPVWEACLVRVGDWAQSAPRSGRSLALVPCPHCGASATRVLRTPEASYGLLCDDCRRTPDLESPIYPSDYFE